MIHVTQVKPLAPLSERGTWLQQTKAVQTYFTLNRLVLPVRYASSNWQAPSVRHTKKKSNKGRGRGEWTLERRMNWEERETIESKKRKKSENKLSIKPSTTAWKEG